MKVMHTKYKTGFTLIELLISIAIIGILSSLVIGGFRVSQMRARDTQRKSDLKQISNALELYYNDHGVYPKSGADGKILACPSTVPEGACEWDEGEFTDGKTTYLRIMPKDPSVGIYFYKSLGQGYGVFAYLENSKDQDISKTEISYFCGSRNCNFALTSTNSTIEGGILE